MFFFYHQSLKSSSVVPSLMMNLNVPTIFRSFPTWAGEKRVDLESFHTRLLVVLLYYKADLYKFKGVFSNI